MPTIQPLSFSVFGFSTGGAAGFLCVLSFTTGLWMGVARLSFFFGVVVAVEPGGPAAGEPTAGELIPGESVVGAWVPGELASGEPEIDEVAGGGESADDDRRVNPFAGDAAFRWRGLPEAGVV
jgi:hypothetical protein